MILNEIKCHVNTSLGLVGEMHPPLCPRLAVCPRCVKHRLSHNFRPQHVLSLCVVLVM